MAEIKVIFELSDATHAEVMLPVTDAFDLLAFLQRDGFVSNDSTVGRVAGALKYVLEPEAPGAAGRGDEPVRGRLLEPATLHRRTGPIPPVNDECPDNDTGDE